MTILSRFRRAAPAGVASLLLLLQPLHVLAETTGNCFEEAANSFGAGTKVSVTTTEGSEVAGRVRFVDFREKLLTLEEQTPEGRSTRTLRLADVSRIQYRTTRSSPGWMWGGMFFGMLAGSTLLRFSRSDDTNPRGSYSFLPVLIGGAAGFVAGTVVSGVAHSEHTIECPLPATPPSR